MVQFARAAQQPASEPELSLLVHREGVGEAQPRAFIARTSAEEVRKRQRNKSTHDGKGRPGHQQKATIGRREAANDNVQVQYDQDFQAMRARVIRLMV